MEYLADLEAQCILCGTHILGVKQPFRIAKSKEIDSWNKESVNSLCEIIFHDFNILNLNGAKSAKNCPEKAKSLLNQASYCYKCRERVWALDLNLKIITKLSREISKLSLSIRKDIYANYKDFDGASNSYMDALSVVFKDLEFQGRFSDLDLTLDPKEFDDDEVQFVSATPGPHKPIPFVRRLRRNRPQITKVESLVKIQAKNTKVDSTSEQSDLHTDFPPDDDDRFSSGGEDFDTNDPDFEADAEVSKIEPKTAKSGSGKRKSQCPQKSAAEKPESDFSSGEDSETSESDSDSDADVTKNAKIKRQTRKSSPKKAPKQKSPNEPRPERIRMKTAKCPEEGCKRYFKDEIAVNAHIRQVHLGLPNPFQCPTCKKDLTDLPYLRTHILTQHEGTFKFSCKLCDKKFSYKHNLRVHMEAAHRILEKFDHVCSICTKGFKTLEDLAEHSSRIHEGPTPFECEDCSKIFDNSSDLIAHYKETHLTAGIPKYLCPLCGKSFATRQYLQAHERLFHTTATKTGDELKCTECNQVFQNLGLFKRHRRQFHSGAESKYTCDICGKSFAGPNGLKYHLSAHSGLKPFKCKICDRAFTQSAHCKKHEQTHSGVKNHICTVCGKGCTNRDNLRYHMRSHSAEGHPPRKKPNKSKNGGNNTEEVPTDLSGVNFNQGQFQQNFGGFANNTHNLNMPMLGFNQVNPGFRTDLPYGFQM